MLTDTIYLQINWNAIFVIIVGTKNKILIIFKIVLYAKIQIIIINALNAIIQINVKNNLMEIYLGNVYAMKDIMMIIIIICVNNALSFGNKILIVFKYLKKFSILCYYNATENQVICIKCV